MKAVRFHAHGGPDVLRYEDAADPIPGPGEALVRVRACALNHLDLWQRRGMERVQIPFPAHFRRGRRRRGDQRAGRRVRGGPPRDAAAGHCRAAAARRASTAATTSARSTTCSAIAATAATPRSSRCRSQNLIAIPDAIGFVEAAAFPLAFLTAWHMLITRAQAARRRRRAGARRRQRRRAGGDPDRVASRRARVRHRAAPTRSWPRRGSSAPTK